MSNADSNSNSNSDLPNESEAFDQLLGKLAEAPEVPIPLAVDIGSVIGDRYQILEFLGSGAMGTVYRVADQDLGEDVALKLLHPRLGTPAQQESLRTEVRMARRIAHPNVCRVHDLGSDRGRFFVTMELLRGETLRDLIGGRERGRERGREGGRERGPREIGLPACIDILVQIATGLGAAHRAGVIHGDVKPDNIILDSSRAVLTDFGIARLARDRTRALAGTPAYMAPELNGERPARPDRRIDTYSFGILAYELLVGTRPPSTEIIHPNISEIRKQQLAAQPLQPLDDLPEGIAAPEIRLALATVLARAIATQPDDRPDPIGVLAQMLSRAARGEMPVAASRIKRSSKHPSRVVTVLCAQLANQAQPTTPPRFASESIERMITNMGGVVVFASENRLEAVFGTPRTTGDEVIRSARAALAIATRVKGTAVALHTGSCVLVPMADGKLAAEGPALTIARELANLVGVTCSVETSAQLAGHFQLHPRDTHGYAVFEGRPTNDLAATRFCGREHELTTLRATFADAFTSRRTQVARIIGPAGIGKTRLCREFVTRLRVTRDLEVLYLAAAPLGDISPLTLLREQVGFEAGQAELHSWLLARASRKPYLVIVDDLQWADPGSREFLAAAENSATQAALGFILVGRQPELPWPAAEQTVTIALDPLEASSATRLVSELAPSASPTKIDAAVIGGQGNPLLLVELGRALAEGRTLPSSVIAAAQKQFDALSPGKQQLAMRAATLGGSFTATDVEILLEEPLLDQTAIVEMLVALVESGIFSASTLLSDVGYRFASPLVQETIYAQTPAEDKRRWHRRCAEHLLHHRSFAQSPTSGRLARIAAHWEHAGDIDAAISAYRQAGERALARAATAEATALLCRAEELTPDTEIDALLLTQIGRSLEHSDGLAAEQRFFRAFSMTVPGDPLRPQLCHLLGICAAGRSDNIPAEGWYRRGLKEIESSRPGELAGITNNVINRGLLLSSLGSLLGYDLHQPADGLALSMAAVELLEKAGAYRELASALASLGANYMRAGRWRDQLDCNQRTFELALEHKDDRAQIRARINLGVVLHNLGELKLATEHTRAALNLSTRLGDHIPQSLAMHNLGMLHLDAGDREGGKQRVIAAIELGERVGYERFFDESYACLSRIAYLHGDYQDAEEQAQIALGVSIASGSEISEGICLRFLAAARAQMGHLDEAFEHLDRAQSCLVERDSYECARNQVVLARLHSWRGLHGDKRAAKRLVQKATVEFTRLGAALDLQHINALDDLR